MSAADLFQRQDRQERKERQEVGASNGDLADPMTYCASKRRVNFVQILRDNGAGPASSGWKVSLFSQGRDLLAIFALLASKFSALFAISMRARLMPFPLQR
jgi:hypothetical protein